MNYECMQIQPETFPGQSYFLCECRRLKKNSFCISISIDQVRKIIDNRVQPLDIGYEYSGFIYQHKEV